MAKMSRKAERDAWTAHVTGTTEVKPSKPSKYGNERTGKYPSKHESDVATKLWALQAGGKISELREQVSFVLVEGRDKILPVIYVADFTWKEDKQLCVADAKGYKKNRVYLLKKKLMKLLLGLDIQEL